MPAVLISQPDVFKIISRRFSSGKNLKMAESEEAEDSVDYYAVLNVRKEVKIVFQRERKREIFDQSFWVHFISFQANENELKAAYRRMCMLYHPDKHQDPAKKKVSLKV